MGKMKDLYIRLREEGLLKQYLTAVKRKDDVRINKILEKVNYSSIIALNKETK